MTTTMLQKVDVTQISTENITIHLSVAKFPTDEEIEQIIRQIRLCAARQQMNSNGMSH